MSDFVDQSVREAFMEFRDDARGEIRAPGPAAVRRTVNRRRGVVGAVAACGLAGVLLGAWALFRPLAAPEPVGSEPPAGPPVLYEASVADAFFRAQFPAYDVAWASIPTAPIWWGPTGTEAVARTFSYAGSQPGEEISMTTACAGTGTVTVSWQTVNQSDEITLSCGEDGVARSTVIETVRADQAIEVTVRGDADVIPEGAFVVLMTDPRSLAAKALLGLPPGQESMVDIGTTYNPFGTGGTTSRRVGPGRYDLTLVCVGDPAPEVEPQVRVQMSLDAGELVGQHSACPPEGGRINLQVSGSSATTLDLSIRSTGSFGYAYYLARTP